MREYPAHPRPNTRQTQDLPLYAFSGKPQPVRRIDWINLTAWSLILSGLACFWYWALFSR